jgi:ketosteroid isomerase-like protein
MTSGHPRSAHVATLIDRYDAAWNAQDLDAIASMHDDAIVFHNHTAGERVAGAPAVRAHIGAIFARWPTLRFERRSLRCGDDFAASEWTARAVHPDDGRQLERGRRRHLPRHPRGPHRAQGRLLELRHATGPLARGRERLLCSSHKLRRRPQRASGLDRHRC